MSTVGQRALFLAWFYGYVAQSFYVSPSNRLGFNPTFYEDVTQFMLSASLTDLKLDVSAGFWIALGFNDRPHMVRFDRPAFSFGYW